MDIIKQTLSPGTDLYEALKDVCIYTSDNDNVLDNNNVDSEKLIEITLSAGNYILLERLQFRSNVVIHGCEGTKVIATNFNGWNDDCLICINGTKSKKLKFEAYNIEFCFGNIAQAPSERFFFKFCHCNKVTIDNCRIHLKNGSITNIDLRCCSNIEIKNCILENFNRCETGGILWIRGETSNVLVSGNTFRKHGNDEAIAIWGSGNTGSETATSVTKQNIRIENNLFEYGEAVVSPYGIDKLITLFDKPADLQVPYRWSNVIIANNRFNISELTYNLIHLSFEQPDTTVENIRIENNTINHLAYIVGRSTNEFVRDISVVSKSEREVNVSVGDNVVHANQTVYADSSKYFHLMIDGANVIYRSNRIDASKLAEKYDSDGNKLNTIGVIFADILSGGACIDIRDNVISGTHMLAQASLGQSSSSLINHVTLNMTNNRIEGDIRIFCRKLERLDLYMHNNRLVSDTYYILLQNFANSGSLILRDNIWKKSAKNTNPNATLFGITDSGTYQFEQIVFTGNVFIDYTQVQIPALPSAAKRMVDGNIYRQ